MSGQSNGQQTTVSSQATKRPERIVYDRHRSFNTSKYFLGVVEWLIGPVVGIWESCFVSGRRTLMIR